MAIKNKNNQVSDKNIISVVKTARIHMWLVGIFMLATILFDSGNLITHELVAWRWTAAGLLLGLSILVWYFARLLSVRWVPFLVSALIIGDIAFATFNVYTQRGMASKAVMLFVIPIIVSLLLQRTSAVLATTGLCVAAYSVAAVRYFHIYFGEGYRVELYGEVGFYSALMFVIAGLLIATNRSTLKT